MEGRIVPYLKEVGLEGNVPGQFKGMYVRTLLRITCVRTHTRVDATCRVHELIFRIATGCFTLHEQLRRHHFLVSSQTSHEFFCCSCSACVIAHMHAGFLKV